MIPILIKTGVPSSHFKFQLRHGGFVVGKTDKAGNCNVDLESEQELEDLYNRRYIGHVEGTKTLEGVKIYALRPATVCNLTLERPSDEHEDGDSQRSGLEWKVMGPHDDDLFMLNLEAAMASLYRHEYEKRFGRLPQKSVFRPRCRGDVADMDDVTLKAIRDAESAWRDASQKLSDWVESRTAAKPAAEVSDAVEP